MTGRPRSGPLTEVTCVQGQSFVVSEGSGDVLVGGDDGVYVRDTRVLDRLELRIDGLSPWPLHGYNLGPASAAFLGFAVRPETGPDPTLLVDRRRVVDGSLHEEVRLTNHGRGTADVEVRFELATDFAYIFDVRHQRQLEHAEAEPIDGGLRFRRPGGDDQVTITSDPAPDHVDPDGLTVRCRLEPSSSTRVCLDLVAVDVYGPVSPGRRCAALATTIPAVVSPTPPLPVTCSSARLTRLLDRSWADLWALRMPDPDEPRDTFLAAGSPWYLTLFGRDSLWAATMLLPFDPSIAAGTLRTLARRQGTRHDAETEEEPGKILHEIRRGALTHRGDLPPNYYGTIDATPLFVVLAHEAWCWGLPDDELAPLIPHVEAALRWLRDDGDPDGDGFVEYHKLSERGLDNQGWKDSQDGIQFADGTIATAPIALAEVQGYAYDAARRGAELLDRFDRPGGDDWRAYADRLAERFRSAFWLEDRAGRYPAVALDHENRPVDGPASNMGHLLATGLLNDDEAALVGACLSSPTLASGFGLRTLADTSRGFNPLSYHAGSVWPHDTAIAVWGATVAGQHAAARQLLDGLVAAATTFDFRLPELFGGFSRDQMPRPVPYPVACRPQAWSAGAALLLLRACLGLRPHVPDGRLVVDPLWPPPVASLEAHDLPLGDRRLSVRIDAHAGVDVTVTGAPLEVEVADRRG